MTLKCFPTIKRLIPLFRLAREFCIDSGHSFTDQLDKVCFSLMFDGKQWMILSTVDLKLFGHSSHSLNAVLLLYTKSYLQIDFGGAFHRKWNFSNSILQLASSWFQSIDLRFEMFSNKWIMVYIFARHKCPHTSLVCTDPVCTTGRRIKYCHSTVIS